MCISSLPLTRMSLPADAGGRCVTGAAEPPVSQMGSAIKRFQLDPQTSSRDVYNSRHAVLSPTLLD